MVFRTLAASAIVILVGFVAIQQVRCTHVENNGLNSFKDEPHNLDIGRRQDGDSLLAEHTIQIDRNRFRWVTYDFKYPEKVVNLYRDVITYIVVTNLDDNNVGGYADLTHGGPGASDATIRLTSRWNKGIHFYVAVYGFPKEQ